MPGHVPVKVRMEASNELRFVGASAGIVRIGAAPTVPVALAPDLVAYLQALEAWAYQLDLAIAPALVAFPPPTILAYGTAVNNRITAADYPAPPPVFPLPPLPIPATFSSITATKLEAK
jgi:predicted NBD/HSP70 family sugar kinase